MSYWKIFCSTCAWLLMYWISVTSGFSISMWNIRSLLSWNACWIISIPTDLVKLWSHVGLLHLCICSWLLTGNINTHVRDWISKECIISAKFLLEIGNQFLLWTLSSILLSLCISVNSLTHIFEQDYQYEELELDPPWYYSCFQLTYYYHNILPSYYGSGFYWKVRNASW